jgi:carbon storage regulator
MLYLTRKIGESVIINNNIELTVIEVRGKSAKLGFTFPTDASVLRKELYERIREENIAAAGADASALDDAAANTLDRATEETAHHHGSDPDE